MVLKGLEKLAIGVFFCYGMSMTMEPIGKASSPYKEKFGIPRQPNLVPEAKGELLLPNTEDYRNAVRNLDGFSHIWVIFQFHKVKEKKFLVRPPRLGGDQKIGVFATRSPFRPNPIGLSVLKLDGIEFRDDEIAIQVSGLDLLDGTPIFDIKPYIAYSDSVPEATEGWIQKGSFDRMKVEFSEEAHQKINALKNFPKLKTLIEQTLSLDPRPVYEEKKEKYAFKLLNWDVHFELVDFNTFLVNSLKNLD